MWGNIVTLIITPTTTARDVIFGGFAFCSSGSTVSPVSSRFTGPIFAAVPIFWFATGVSRLLTSLFAVCVFLSVDFPHGCCPYRRISIWTGVGENFHL